MDDYEKASEFEQLRRDIALKIRKPVPEITGHCLNCGEPVTGRYCNAECREDHETRERLSRHD